METNVILKKGVDNNTLLQYFGSINELSRSGNEFPVNFDQVWGLVYTNRGDAVNAMMRDFIENEDYLIFRRNPKNSQRGRKKIEYYISIACLEYFIVKKNRAVFEVYRKVFHKVVQGAANGDMDKVEILADSLGIDTNSPEFLKAVAERSDCLIAANNKQLNFWRSVANQQQMRILELENLLQNGNPT